MWIACNKDGSLRVFEKRPRRFHEGALLDHEFVGFNDAIEVGDGKDDYSFWAEQEYCESNEIPDKKCYGIGIYTETIENDTHYRTHYVPEWAKDMTWEDEPIEVYIVPKQSFVE